MDWTVLRFENEEVIADVDGVYIAISRHLGIERGGL
jgi:very-short-patch-repair endonuclease